MPKEIKIDGSRIILMGKRNTEKINIYKADSASYKSYNFFFFNYSSDFYSVGVLKIHIDNKIIRLFFRVRNKKTETEIKKYLAEKTAKY